jgi:transposase-like protein
MQEYSISLDANMVKDVLLNPDRDGVLARLLELVVNQLLSIRAEQLCNAAPWEQTEDRVDYRNGTRSRSLITRIGKIVLAVPRLRDQPFTTELFESYKRSEQALIEAVAEMVVKGVSTRGLTDVAETLMGTPISKSQVSRMCEVLDPVVREFRERPLNDYYPFVIVDAMYIKVRSAGKVVSKALYTAIGVNVQGYKEVLGFLVAENETKGQYTEFFRSLMARGMKRVDLVVSDDHAGLTQAVREVFVGAMWQRCQTHFSKNVLDKTPKKLWGDVKVMLRDINTAPDIDTARQRKDVVVTKLAALAPKAAKLIDDSFDDIAAVFALPAAYRQSLRTSNIIERVNEELRRRERPLRIFPSDDSVARIIGTVLMSFMTNGEQRRGFST